MSSGEQVEQAPWVKPGVRVRWKGVPFGVGGVVVEHWFGGLGVQYDDSSVVWEGDIASSWEAASGVGGSPSVMLDGGPCAKPEAPDGLEQLDKRLREALWLYRDKPTSAASFDALRRLWDLLTSQFGGAWSRAHGDVCGDHVGRVRSEACYVCKASPMQACGSTTAPVAPNPSSFVQSPVAARVTELILGEQASRPVSTMEQVIARLDAIDAALMPLAHLALDAEGRVVAVPPISPPTAPPNVPAHEERYAAAREAMYYDTYGAACPRCKAPRWGGCVAVDGDPPDVAPDQAILVRVEYQNGDHVFQHISWPSDQLVAVARGFFEACSALECDVVSAPRRPGLERVARLWDSLTKVEQDYWCNVVRGFLDGSSDPGLSTVEEVVLGAMVRVFGLQRKA